MKKILFIPLLLITSLAFATPPTRQSTYTTGTTIRSTDVTSNEDAIFNYLQTGVDTIASNSVTSSTISDGTITNNDVDSSAAIAYSKLNLSSSIVTGDITDGTIVNADISTSASIADTKLAQITTASKVSGTAMTGLSSIVSGAGRIPTANLGTGTASASNYLLGDQSWGTIAVTLKSFLTTGGNIGGSATEYIGPGDSQSDTTSTSHDVPMPLAGTARNLYVYTDDNQAGTMVITVYKNGSAGALTCTVSSAGQTCNDTTNTISFTAGDRLMWEVVNNRVAAKNVRLALEYDI